jgi:outer membrane protein OmpA-like peptidoglycan-associated protein
MRTWATLAVLLAAATTASGDASTPPESRPGSLVSCPKPAPGDADGDGIPDAADKCPGEPETWNGWQDDDGCPDKGRVIVGPDRIETLDRIFFETGKDTVKPISDPILNALVVALRHVCGAPIVEVGIHSDARGDDEYNLRLTQARADAVLKILVDRGVPAARLRARGYGETQPLCKEPNEKCWSMNRRTEFLRKP